MPRCRRISVVETSLTWLVVEWDGRAWWPVAVAADFGEAYPLIVRRDGQLVEAQDDTPVALPRKGSGRHRRPLPPSG